MFSFYRLSALPETDAGFCHTAQVNSGPDIGDMVYRVWFTPHGVDSASWPSGIADADNHHCTYYPSFLAHPASGPAFVGRFISDSPQYSPHWSLKP